ncbi:aminotransferase class I/II-fold pyridoxal phosphate-dependent enzyme [Erysipelothrix rhusiopathiae]|nr:aminotransferase class I/II-fold pyridoxal phosphate-dependent enzyme [Erysipelothrix rhusiopathiae]MDE8120043.1 aminotransferase class I/II-fold pyridoxal phosphate-dependent enzyme [Erysipelothrix rhusiopathiae]MDE8133449.1 aminotransferase class I/II-fold pyridoxal phosphate-dependent enzyme [Erysipelothrix rhusiopathiae]MDE8148382.1 aminotransferase class I/II-fold pyridoxal phosphate-dependent enzyme [Erysipelothrix rhusiopathiae]MDE8194504.1 aminotransferase class I/II-fold pyridoxal p
MKKSIKTLERIGNGSKKWDKTYISKRFQIEEPTQIYPMFIADMDFRHDDKIIEHLKLIIEQDDFGYFDVTDSYYQSIVTWHKNNHNLAIKPDWIIPANGTITSLHFVMDTLNQKGNILLMTPVYGVFQSIADRFGKRFEFPLTFEDNNYDIDFKELENTILTSSIDTILFCNPHNPSGKVWSYETVESLVNLCKKYDVLLVSDEIHADFVHEGYTFNSILTFRNDYDKIVVSTSANKTFNLSGLNSSYLLCPDESLRSKIESHFNRYHISINRIGMEATRIAYEEGYNWMETVKDCVVDNISCLYNVIQNTDLQVIKPESGYLVWVYCPRIQDMDAYVIDLAQSTGVLLETGSRFVGNYKHCLRINVAMDTESVKEAMKKFVDHYVNYEGDTNEIN